MLRVAHLTLIVAELIRKNSLFKTQSIYCSIFLSVVKLAAVFAIKHIWEKPDWRNSNVSIKFTSFNTH